MNNEIEQALSQWVWELWHMNVFVTDSIIKAKARKLWQAINIDAGDRSKYGTRFSNGWLYRFKKRNLFKSYTAHGESGDADVAAAEAELPILRSLVRYYGERNVYNADEFGLWYRQIPTRSIGPARLRGRKQNKDRITFLVCGNADGTERTPPLVIGRATMPKCFGGRTGTELGFQYTSAPRAWMTKSIFFSWLRSFDESFAHTPERRILLLVDNASSHGVVENLPTLHHVRVYFLPKKTTSILQLLDAGEIACIKKHYRKRRTERDVNLLEPVLRRNCTRLN